jgi:hypothetical protein
MGAMVKGRKNRGVIACDQNYNLWVSNYLEKAKELLTLNSSELENTFLLIHRRELLTNNLYMLINS